MDPVALFADTIKALRQHDWLNAASNCDPVSLAAFKRHFVQSYDPSRPPDEDRALSAEDYMRHEPGLPREAADYYVARHLKEREARSKLDSDLPGITTFEELQACTPAAVFASWLRGRSMSHQIAMMVQSGRIPAEHVDHLGTGANDEFAYRAVGYVTDDNLAYIVYRSELKDVSPEADTEIEEALVPLPDDELQLMRDTVAGDPQVMTARLQPDGSWRLLASHMFLGQAGVFWFGCEPTDQGAVGME